MKKSRLTEEQIIGFLKQAEAGMPIKELCRNGGFSNSTFYGWRAKLGGMQVSEAQHLLTEAHMNMHALVAVCGERWAPPCRENSHINGLLRNA
ncbi:transposase [Hydrogenophaga aromaticivorans]